MFPLGAWCQGPRARKQLQTGTGLTCTLEYTYNQEVVEAEKWREQEPIAL